MLDWALLRSLGVTSVNRTKIPALMENMIHFCETSEHKKDINHIVGDKDYEFKRCGAAKGGIESAGGWKLGPLQC